MTKPEQIDSIRRSMSSLDRVIIFSLDNSDGTSTDVTTSFNCLAGDSKDKLCADFLTSFQTMVTTEIAIGGSIKIRNFLNISSTKSASRRGINPQNGKRLIIPASTKAKFKVSKNFKSILNPVVAVAV